MIYRTQDLLYPWSTVPMVYRIHNLPCPGSILTHDLPNPGSTVPMIYRTQDLLNPGSTVSMIYRTQDLPYPGSNEPRIYHTRTLDLPYPWSTKLKVNTREVTGTLVCCPKRFKKVKFYNSCFAGSFTSWIIDTKSGFCLFFYLIALFLFQLQ